MRTSTPKPLSMHPPPPPQVWLSYAAGSAAASDFGSPNSTMGGDAQFFGMMGGSGGGGFGAGFSGSPLLPPLLHPSSAPLAPGSYPPGLPASVLDKLTYLAVKRAIAAMEAAALKGEAYVSQVGTPLEICASYYVSVVGGIWCMTPEP